MILRNYGKFCRKICMVFALVHCVVGDSAWFQVCDMKQKFSLTSTDCELGLWLNKPVKVDCVCVHGVWIVAEDLCDEDVMVLVGNGDCFILNKQIRSVKLLGDPENPFTSKSYVSDDNFDTYVEIPVSDYNPRLDSQTSMVVSIFPKKSLRRSDHEVCIGNESSSFKPVHIWKNARRVTSRFRFVDSFECDLPAKYDFHVGLGEIYQDSKVLPVEDVKGLCSGECLGSADHNAKKKKNNHQPLGRGIGRTAASPQSSLTSKNTDLAPIPKARWSNLYSITQKLEFSGGSGQSEAQLSDKRNWYNFRWNFTLPPLSHSRETREQSVRMVQAQTNFLLLNQPPPQINTPEYDYFQKLRQVFLAVTPGDIIDKDIVNGLMRMFRVLLWESHDKFQYRETPNMEPYARIMAGLNECLWNVSAYPFVFSGLVNQTAKPVANSTHWCIEDTVAVYWNNSDQSSASGGTTAFLYTYQNFTNEKPPKIIPPREPFNLKMDFVIETAWKIYEFGFFRCLSHFEQQATDGHELAEKVQSLFNPRVVRRWYQPEDFNLVLPLIFPNLNQSLFAWAVDKMLLGSRDYSGWENLQQKRPVLMTEDDIPNFKEIPSRRKRAAKKHKFRQEIFWGSRAHCMFSFTDPVQQFKYTGKQGCLISHPT